MTKRPVDPTIWMDVPDTAKALGVTRQTVYTWIAKGKLEADTVAKRLLVRRASIPVGLLKENGHA
jgi:excisionase family DNA binding protein